MSNRYFQINNQVPQVQPLELDYQQLATPLLMKQKKFDDTVDEASGFYDALLKVQSLPGDDTSYVQQAKDKLRGVVDKYSSGDYDLTNPKIRRQFLDESRAIAQDPNLSTISSTYAQNAKEVEAMYEARKKGETIADHNLRDYTTTYGTITTPGSGGSLTHKLQGVYGNSNIPEEAAKYFNMLKADGSDKFAVDEGLGLLMKYGWEGVSNGKVDKRVAETYKLFRGSAAAEEIGRMYDAYDKGASGMSKEQYILNEFWNYGKGYVHGKNSLDYPQGLNEDLGEKKARGQRPDVYGLQGSDVLRDSLGAISNAVNGTLPGSPAYTVGPMGAQVSSVSSTGTPPPKTYEDLQKKLTKPNLDLFDDITQDIPDFQGKLAKWNEYVEEYDAKPQQFPVATSRLKTLNNKGHYLDTKLDPESETKRPVANYITGANLVRLEDNTIIPGVDEELQQNLFKSDTKGKLDINDPTFRVIGTASPTLTASMNHKNPDGSYINFGGGVVIQAADGKQYIVQPPMSQRNTQDGYAEATANHLIGYTAQHPGVFRNAWVMDANEQPVEQPNLRVAYVGNNTVEVKKDKMELKLPDGKTMNLAPLLSKVMGEGNTLPATTLSALISALYNDPQQPLTTFGVNMQTLNSPFYQELYQER